MASVYAHFAVNNHKIDVFGEIQWNKNILLSFRLYRRDERNIHRTQDVSCNKRRCLTLESTQRWMKWDLLANSVRPVFNGVAVICPKRLLRITRSIFAPLARFYAVWSVVEGPADVVRQGVGHSPHRSGRSVQFSSVIFKVAWVSVKCTVRW